VVLDSGEVLTGLVRREEGETLVLADQKGKEFRVALGDIETRKDSQLSLMPANVGETLPAEDLSHLLRFLLESRERMGAGAGK
jgi:hypothetical protein